MTFNRDRDTGKTFEPGDLVFNRRPCFGCQIETVQTEQYTIADIDDEIFRAARRLRRYLLAADTTGDRTARAGLIGRSTG